MVPGWGQEGAVVMERSGRFEIHGRDEPSSLSDGLALGDWGRDY